MVQPAGGPRPEPTADAIEPHDRPTAPGTTPEQVLHLVEDLVELPYGLEPIDQRSHALQCAALAEDAGSDDEVVVAALLHDIGRSRPVARTFAELPHEKAGERFCRPRFGERVAWLVAQHVPAKRYLVTVDPAYHDGLSEESVVTLVQQGGPMSMAEVTAFERHPDHQEAASLRRWDDLAKVPGVTTPTLEHFSAYVERCWIYA